MVKLKINTKEITMSNNSSNKQTKLYQMVTWAIFVALICIFAPLSVPIGPIPISLTNLILYIAIFIIGTRGTLISYVVYLLLGIVGLPVFSGYAGGIAKVLGPTGGYLVGFIPMIIIMGLVFEKTVSRSYKLNVSLTFVAMILGTLVAYALGTIWFVYQMDCTFAYALGVCVFPFIPFDIAKMVIATFLGKAVRIPLLKQGLIEK